MGTTAQKGAYLLNTKSLLKDKINALGGDIDDETTFREYANQLDAIYDHLPKTEYQEGTEVNLGKTLKGKLDYDNGVVGIGQTSQKILPNEYQEVEYIESSGTQYIDTVVKGNNNIKLDFKFKTKTIEGSRGICGYFTGNTENLFLHSSFDTSVQVGFGGYQNLVNTYSSNQMYAISLYNGKITINGSEITIPTASTFETGGNLYIFKVNNSTAGGLPIQLYKFKIYDNNVLVRDFIPCYRINDNVIGLYDIVNNVFYTNSGTGTFTKGANAPTPSQEIPIKCVKGNQDVVISGKNLLKLADDETTISGTAIKVSNGVISLNGTATDGTIYTKTFDNFYLEPGTYTLGATYSGASSINQNFALYSGNTIVTACGYNYSSSETKTFTERTQITKMSFWISQGTINTNFKTKIQLERGSTATEWEEYHTPTTYQLSLGDIELAKIGTYKDNIYLNGGKWYLHKEVGKVVLNGTEEWTLVNDGIGGTLVQTPPILEIKPSSSIYSNYYRDVDIWNYNVTAMQVNWQSRIRIKNIEYTTLDEYTNWLSTHNTILYYVLATPTETEITNTTLISQLNAWYNAHSNNGTTVIETNGNLPMIIKVRGLKGAA